MSDNAKKTHLAVALDNIPRQRAADAIQSLGKELPCHVTKIEGQIVTVAFDTTSPFTLPQVTMPINSFQDDWLPIQVGDKGVARTADVYLGGVSGLGTGNANLLRQSNLSMLVFHPATNKAWTPPGGFDQNDRIMQSRGKGVALVSKDAKTKLYVDDDGHVVITGDLRVTGEVIRGFGTGDQVTLGQHTHAQDADSDADSEEETHKPTAGT